MTAYYRTMQDASDAAINMAKSANGAIVNLEQIPKTSKAAEIGLKALSVAANIAISVGITATITLISKLVTSYSDMIAKAQEATTKFNEQSTSIDTNKKKITELRDALDNENLSYEEAKSKREELISIQRELLSSYDSEIEGIDLVNGKYEEQIALLDKVNEKKRQEWKNSVNELSNGSEIWNWWTTISKVTVDQATNPLDSIINNTKSSWDMLNNLIDGKSFEDSLKEYFGYTDTATDLFGNNLDKISDKVEKFEAKFKATDNLTLNNLIKSFDGIEFDGKEFTISGNVEDVSDTIATIQTQLKDIPGYTDDIDNKLTKIYNDAQEISSESIETYKTAIQNEILDDNTLKDYYNKLSQAYQEYQDVLTTGDEESINKAKSNYSNVIGNVLSNGNIAQKYKTYFSELYPDLQSIVNDWNFEVKIEPNLNNFKNNNLLKEFSIEEILEQFKEGGNNLSEIQKEELANLNQMATECGMSLDDFLYKLGEVNVAQSQLEKDFLKKIDFTGRSNADPVKQYLSSLTDEDYTLLLNADIPISSKTWVEQDWKNFIEQLKFTTGELTIDFNPETAFDAMTTALSEQKEQGYLTDETLQSLKSTYGDLTNILTYSENGIVLNTEAMVDYTNQVAEASLVSLRMKESLSVKDYQKAAKELEGYKSEHKGLEDALKGSTSELNDFLSSLDETERVNIQSTIDQMQTLSDTINGYDALEAKIRATTSALHDYVRATSTANNADNFDTARGGLESTKELFKNGWTGKDDYKTYIDYIGKYNEEMNNYQSPESYFKRAERYLTEDISGVYNFLDDAVALNKGWITNTNGQYDIAIDNLDAFAKDMDMSLSFVTDMLLATSEAWDFDIDFSSLSEGLVDGLNALEPASENARTNLEEFRKTIESLDEAGYDTTKLWNEFNAVEKEFNKDIEFTLSISDMSKEQLLKEATDVADEVAKEIGIKEIKFDMNKDNTDSLLKTVSTYRDGLKEGTDEYNKAQLVIAQLIQRKQELENPAIMSIDTSGMSDEMSGAIALVQQWVDASNELERTKKLGLDTTQAQEQVDTLTTKLVSLPSTTMANLGLNISDNSSVEEIKSQISSIDVNALAKDTNVKITADTTPGETSLKKFKEEINATTATVNIEGKLAPDFNTNLQEILNGRTFKIKVQPSTTTIKPQWTGSAKANGSAKLNGTAFARGKWTVGTSGKSLVGELGTEILVRDGEFRTIGDNGAEFIDVKSDDIIFNHKQTEQILKYGHINSRGQALLHGSAFTTLNQEESYGSGGSDWKNKNSKTSKSNGKSNNKNNNNDKDKSKSKTLIDWIDRRFNVLKTKAERWANIIENATNSKRLDTYYKKLEDNYKKQVKSYSDGATRYLQKANSIKISSNKKTDAKLKNKVKSKDSSIFNKDGSMKSYKTLIKNYGEKTASKIQDYQNYIDKYESALDGFIEATKNLYQAPIEKAADKIELLSKSVDVLDAKLENISVDDYVKANANINEQTKNAKKQLEANQEALKSAQDNYNSTKSAITNKKNLEANDLAGNKKTRESSAKAIKDAVAKGEEIDISLYKVNSSGYKAAIKYNAALKAQKDATDALTLSQEEYTKTARENEKAKFDNIKNAFENQIKLIDNQFTSLDNKIAEIEASGANVNKAYYQSQKEINDQIKQKYVDEKKALEEQIATIPIGTQAWYDAKDAIQECDNKISDCVKTTYELNNAINELHFKMFDYIADSIDRVITEQEFLQSLFAHEKNVDKDTGAFTDAGIAKLGSLSASYYLSKEKAKNDEEEVKELQRMLDSNSLHSDILGITFNSADDLQDKFNEKYTTWQKDIKDTYNLKSDLADMTKEKYQAELDLLDELIKKKSDALQAEKDLHDYKLSIAEKSKNILTLQKQLAALQGDTSQEGMAKKQKIQVSLDEAIKDRQETEYEKAISTQTEMLEKLSQEANELVEKKLDDSMTLVKEGLETANTNTANIETYLSQVSAANGYVEQYKGLFTGVSGSIENSTKSIVTAIENKVIDLSGTKDETPTPEPQPQPQPSGDTLDKGTGYIPIAQQSYDPIVNSNTNTSDTLKDTATEFIIANASKPSKNKSEYSDLNKKIWDLTNGKILEESKRKELAKMVGVTYDGAKKTNNLYKKLESLKISGFKRGGVVSVDDIEKQIKANGDNTLVSANPGERILTPLQNDLFEKFVGNLPQLTQMTDAIKPLVNLPKMPDVKPLQQPLQNNIQAEYNFTLENCTNAQDIINCIQKDQKVQKALRAVTTDEVMGKGRLGVNRIR